MSLAPFRSIREELDRIVRAARGLGSPLHDPFMAMSFLALEVIPALKITDMGLVDVHRFEPVAERVCHRRRRRLPPKDPQAIPPVGS